MDLRLKNMHTHTESKSTQCIQFHISPFIFRRLLNCINMAKINLVNHIKYPYFKSRVIINGETPLCNMYSALTIIHELSKYSMDIFHFSVRGGGIIRQHLSFKK